MMRQLNVLDPKFREKLELVLKRTKDKGYVLVPYYTRRSLQTQAKLWRQSRTWQEIKRKIDYFRDNNCNYLADILKSVGPQMGRWATNAPPGFSWHQYDLAADCFIMENNKAIWDDKHKGYLMYYRMCEEAGIYSGYDFGDINHCQDRLGSVLDYYSLEEIDRMMQEKFGIK